MSFTLSLLDPKEDHIQLLTVYTVLVVCVLCCAGRYMRKDSNLAEFLSVQDQKAWDAIKKV